MTLFRPPPLDAKDRRAMEIVLDQHRKLRHQVAAPHRWMRLLRRVALARAVRGSNTIEGFTVSVDDAFAALDDQEPMDAEELAWQAVRGYRDAMTYVLQLAKREPLSVSSETILALHFMMQQYDLDKWPGRWRPGQVFVFDAKNDEIVYVGPDAELVPALVDELVTELSGIDLKSEPLITASMAHLNLVMIHPFKDGNGRMARCLQTLLLAAAGTAAAPELASIEEYLGEHEQDYYQVLAEVGGGEWGPERDTRPWIRFILTAHYRQTLRVERRAEVAGRLWMRAEDEVAKARLPERCVQPLTYCMSGLYLRNSTYRQLVPEINQNVASRDLNELVRAGLLAAHGEKRGRRYLPSPDMHEVAMAVRAEVRRRIPATGDPYE
jgi:Fic family protein